MKAEAWKPYSTVEQPLGDTNNLQLYQKSNLLHAVALSAANELHSKKEEVDEAGLEDMAHKERLHEADELSEQAIELDHMTFSAKDLNSFSALAD